MVHRGQDAEVAFGDRDAGTCVRYVLTQWSKAVRCRLACLFVGWLCCPMLQLLFSWLNGKSSRGLAACVMRLLVRFCMPWSFSSTEKAALRSVACKWCGVQPARKTILDQTDDFLNERGLQAHSPRLGAY